MATGMVRFMIKIRLFPLMECVHCALSRPGSSFPVQNSVFLCFSDGALISADLHRGGNETCGLCVLISDGGIYIDEEYILMKMMICRR
jgi:hypothetical protein